MARLLIHFLRLNDVQVLLFYSLSDPGPLASAWGHCWLLWCRRRVKRVEETDQAVRFG